MILGTAAYMSPEQARGQVVDKRTDIWAFGCVLYELLTGRPAFARATFSDTIAAVLAHEPDWTALPRDNTAVFVAPSQTVPGEGFGAASAGYRRRTSRARWGDEPPAAERERREPDTPLARAHGRRRWSRASSPSLPRAFALGVFVRPEPSPPAQVTAVRFSVFPPQGGRFLHNVAHVPRAILRTDRNWHSSPSRLQTLLRCGFGRSQSSRRASCPAPRGRRRSSGRQTVDPSRSLRAAS